MGCSGILPLSHIAWQCSPDKRGVAAPKKFTMMEEYLLSVWHLRRRQKFVMLEYVGGASSGSISSMINTWVPRLGRVGRSWVWMPGTDHITASMPQSFIESGMDSTAYIEDCTDLLTQTVRKMISVRNQMHSDKSKHSAAMGLSWCTPSG